MTSIEGAPAARGTGSGDPHGTGPNVRMGVFSALGAYGMWGLFPLFFKLVESVDALSVVANRVVFSLIFLCVILAFRRQFAEVIGALKNRKTVFVMLVTTILLAFNWLIFVWAVSVGQVLQISFGYFINPLVSIAIGMAFLGERQSPLQALAIGIAVVAVGIQWLGLGAFPWIAISLALLFGFYGYFRKTVSVGSNAGLFVETLLMAPFAIGWIAYGVLVLGHDYFADPVMGSAMVFSGPLTALALIFFAYAARQLRLTTVGMFQYIAPSLHFATAVFLFREALEPLSLLSFVLIWCSLALFSWDSWRRRGRATRPA